MASTVKVKTRNYGCNRTEKRLLEADTNISPSEQQETLDVLILQSMLLHHHSHLFPTQIPSNWEIFCPLYLKIYLKQLSSNITIRKGKAQPSFPFPGWFLPEHVHFATNRLNFLLTLTRSHSPQGCSQSPSLLSRAGGPHTLTHLSAICTEFYKVTSCITLNSIPAFQSEKQMHL